jgi:hypothetical protein
LTRERSLPRLSEARPGVSVSMLQPGSGITVEPREIDPSQSDPWIDDKFFGLDRGMRQTK